MPSRILFYKTDCKVGTTTPIFHLVKLLSQRVLFVENAAFCTVMYLAFFLKSSFNVPPLILIVKPAEYICRTKHI